MEQVFEEEQEKKPMELIDRKKAIEAIMDLPNCSNGFSDTYDKARIISELEEVPIIDAIEAVRCKDCRYRGNGYEGFGYYLCTKLYQLMYEDEYCSRGERREDAAKGHEG